MAAKDRLHSLVDELAEQDVPTAERLLEAVRSGDYDPLLLSLLAAPMDDEPTTPDEDESAREAQAQYRRGEAVSAEQAKRMLLP